MSRTKKIIEEHLKCINKLAGDPGLLKKLDELAILLTQTLKDKKRVWFCGNGGSASDASHLAAELSGKFNMDRAPLKAEMIHSDITAFSAVSNDYGYAQSFARLLEAKADPGDVLIALSTSGASENVVEALKKAQSLNVITASITGNKTTEMKQLSRIHLAIPSDNTARIQEATLLLGHILCEKVENNIFGN